MPQCLSRQPVMRPSGLSARKRGSVISAAHMGGLDEAEVRNSEPLVSLASLSDVDLGLVCVWGTALLFRMCLRRPCWASQCGWDFTALMGWPRGGGRVQ